MPATLGAAADGGNGIRMASHAAGLVRSWAAPVDPLGGPAVPRDPSVDADPADPADPTAA